MTATERLIKAFEKFNEELKAFGKETGEELVTLYEDAHTTRMVKDFKLYKSGKLTWIEYDSWELEPVKESYLHFDEDDIRDSLKFWRAALKRAKRYWAMDTEKLDKIQDGEIEDTEDDE